MKRQEMVNYLDAIGWLDYTTEDVLKKCEKWYDSGLILFL
jgi:hypothetical protein